MQKGSPQGGPFCIGAFTETSLGSESKRRRREDVRSEAEDNPVGCATGPAGPDYSRTGSWLSRVPLARVTVTLKPPRRPSRSL